MSNTPPFTAADIESGKCTKRETCEWFQAHGNTDFLREHGLFGNIKNVAKNARPPQLCAALANLEETKRYRDESAPSADEEAAKARELREQKEKEDALAAVAERERMAAEEERRCNEPKKFSKLQIITPGDKKSYPHLGDRVRIRYRGSLPDGTVFDSCMDKIHEKGTRGGKLPQPLQCKLGSAMIRGMEEAILTMTIGEKAKFSIEAEWGYGHAGIPDPENRAGMWLVPPDTDLVFEIELISIG